MPADRAGKFDATSCRHYQDDERAMCLACANKALRGAFEAGVRSVELIITKTARGFRECCVTDERCVHRIAREAEELLEKERGK